MNLNDLQTFALVAKHGTLTEAATVLDVPKSTVSRRITRLEDSLGVALFSRASRRIVLTQDGRAFLNGLMDCSRAFRKPDGFYKSKGWSQKGFSELQPPKVMAKVPPCWSALRRISNDTPR